MATTVVLELVNVVVFCCNKSFICDLIFIQPATVVGLVSTVRKSVTAKTRMRTVKIIRQKADVPLAVLHTSRGQLVKVTYFVSSKILIYIYKLIFV